MEDPRVARRVEALWRYISTLGNAVGMESYLDGCMGWLHPDQRDLLRDRWFEMHPR